jgi:hypothetical protein
VEHNSSVCYITLLWSRLTPTLYYFIISSHPEMAAAAINYNPPLLLFLTASKVKIISSAYTPLTNSMQQLQNGNSRAARALFESQSTSLINYTHKHMR